MTEFNFEPPSPGSWDKSRTGFALVNEEAAHAAICLLLSPPGDSNTRGARRPSDL